MHYPERTAMTKIICTSERFFFVKKKAGSAEKQTYFFCKVCCIREGEKYAYTTGMDKKS